MGVGWDGWDGRRHLMNPGPPNKPSFLGHIFDVPFQGFEGVLEIDARAISPNPAKKWSISLRDSDPPFQGFQGVLSRDVQSNRGRAHQMLWITHQTPVASF